MKSSAFWLALGLAVSATPLQAAECSAASGPQRTSLLELYTSQGCSSCPPADRWLSGLQATSRTGQQVVALALHVDYWDYIGWRDRFAQPGFAVRQREAALLAHSSLVYTPQLLLNGRDYRDWRSAGRFERQLASLAAEPAPATIKLSLQTQAPDTLALSASAQTGRPGRHALFLALYENGLTSHIERGENAGTTLKHDFVVRSWLGPYALDSSGGAKWQQTLRLDREWRRDALGVAAFVQNTTTGEVLQALALPLCGV